MRKSEAYRDCFVEALTSRRVWWKEWVFPEGGDWKGAEVEIPAGNHRGEVLTLSVGGRFLDVIWEEEG